MFINLGHLVHYISSRHERQSYEIVTSTVMISFWHCRLYDYACVAQCAQVMAAGVMQQQILLFPIYSHSLACMSICCLFSPVITPKTIVVLVSPADCISLMCMGSCSWLHSRCLLIGLHQQMPVEWATPAGAC